MAKGKFTFLGTGASTGVPIIGCECSVCRSKSIKNKRLRPSGLIELENKKILIDVGPDFRQQAIKYKIHTLDGLILTHIHSDHIAGVDDLRVYYFRSKERLPCLLSAESLDDLKVRYHYLFLPIDEVPTITTQFELSLLEEEMGEKEFLGINIGYVSYFQVGVKVTGFRIGDFAYLTDIKEYGEEIFLGLKGVNTLVVSSLRHISSPAHFNIEESVEFVKKVGAKKAFFTHICHELDHETTNLELPKDIQLAFDGQIIEFTY